MIQNLTNVPRIRFSGEERTSKSHKIIPKGEQTISLFARSYLAYKPWLISQRIVFFSHTKPANSIFSHDLYAKQAQTNRAYILALKFMGPTSYWVQFFSSPSPSGLWSTKILISPPFRPDLYIPLLQPRKELYRCEATPIKHTCGPIRWTTAW